MPWAPLSSRSPPYLALRDATQAVMYLIFVVTFQYLTESLRMKEEFFFDKMISDTFIENHFDSSHNELMDIRRVADIYEYANVVFIPALFGNAGPCGALGKDFGFDSSRARVPAETDLAAAMAAKGCNDHVWPDGDGAFHVAGASAKTVAEYVDELNVLDWTEGIAIFQARVAPMNASQCDTRVLGSVCYPEQLGEASEGAWATEPFGHNWTHPGAPLDHPFVWYTAEELGANPAGTVSAAIPSMRTMPADGYVATIVPQHGQSGRVGGPMAGLNGLIRLHLKAWGCPLHT